MSYGLLISYAHQGDNISRQEVKVLVKPLHDELEADFRNCFKRDLNIIFDENDNGDFEHWKVSCHRALRESRFFIACLSGAYIRSDIVPSCWRRSK